MRSVRRLVWDLLHEGWWGLHGGTCWCRLLADRRRNVRSKGSDWSLLRQTGRKLLAGHCRLVVQPFHGRFLHRCGRRHLRSRPSRACWMGTRLALQRPEHCASCRRSRPRGNRRNTRKLAVAATRVPHTDQSPEAIAWRAGNTGHICGPPRRDRRR